MKVERIDDLQLTSAGIELLVRRFEMFCFGPATHPEERLVAVLPEYNDAGVLVAFDVCTITDGEEYRVGDERLIAAATFIKDQAADRRRLALELNRVPTVFIAPTALTSERVPQEAVPMNDKHDEKKHDDKHDHHKDREDHRARSLSAMSKHHDAAGRARAFVTEQVAFMRRRAAQIVAGMRDGSLSLDEAAAVIEGDIAHEEDNNSAIAQAIASGVPA